VSDLPGLFDVRVKARSIAYLFAVGASLGLLTLAFPHAKTRRRASCGGATGETTAEAHNTIQS